MEGMLGSIMVQIAAMLVALFTAGVAWYRARSGRANYYADQVYGMTARTEGGYAGFCAALFMLSGASLFFPVIPGMLMLGTAVITAVFYFTSFARGFSDEE